MYSYDLPYFADSSELFARIADLPQAVWLDSCAQFGSQGRYDIMAAEPQLQLRGTLEQLEIRTPHGHYQQSGDCFGFIAEQLAALPRELPQNLPFCGGLIGYFAYELGTGLGFNRVKTQQPNIPLDDINAGIYAWTLIQDHHSKRCWLLCLKTCPAAVREDIQRRCRSAAPVAEHGYRAGHFSANMSRAEYLAKLAVIDDYIHAGDCYQVNFAQRFSAEFSGSALAAYNQLRRQLPSPYSAFMQLDRGAILSHSPERFLRVQGERVDTKPIKGTIARGKTPAEDQALAKQLQNSIKDRAENLMIVDLLRNDLSRSCKLGSVR
ncbi:MAG: chorismate-binding protein, partial [Cellvibrionaceae bacterium]|nr:chorismate-binding protein [Cellvibrionaceae bacterium]